MKVLTTKLPSYLFFSLSVNVIEIPLFKNDNSRIRADNVSYEYQLFE
jgi:hypothetical protein